MSPEWTLIYVMLVFVVVLGLMKPAMRKPVKTNTDPASEFDDWKVRERWEDYPAVKYDQIHTYCTVTLEGSGKTLYYRTRNPELTEGDLVYVPVGSTYEKKIGTIVNMKDYLGYLAPYPLEKTKHIIGKV